ncbi:MAG TPA: uridine kinase [Actinomycetes bacterium]
MSAAGRAPPARAALLQGLAELVAALRRPHPVRVAVDGPDAAGKTTLADELATVLEARGRTVVRASVDGFHRPRAERYRRGERSPEGYWLDSFDHQAIRASLLDPLGPGGSRRYRTRTFDFRRDRPRAAPVRVAPEDAILVFDGVFLLGPELDPAWDFRIFVDVPFSETLRRAVARDRDLFGSADAVRERYRQRYVPGQRLYFAAARPREHADVVVDNRDPAAPKLVAARWLQRASPRRQPAAGP